MLDRDEGCSSFDGTARRWTLAELAVWPSIVFFCLLVVLQLGGIDDFVAGLFYDPGQGSFPLKHNFWTERVLHDGGQSVMKGLGLLLLVAWLVSLRMAGIDAWRRALAYILVVMVLSVGVVNLGKALSNMDCPWDLVGFGGNRLHYGLFQDKPDHLPVGRCYPGGHSSGGFALFALFFVGRGLGYRRSWLTLVPALSTGGVFAVDQWARGAHFPSHDLTTAYLCWMIALGTHVGMFRNGKFFGRSRPAVDGGV